MSHQYACERCGAPLAIPTDDSVLTCRCGYCGAEQLLPDHAERRARLERRTADARAEEQRRLAAYEASKPVLRYDRPDDSDDVPYAEPSRRPIIMIVLGGVAVVGAFAFFLERKDPTQTRPKQATAVAAATRTAVTPAGPPLGRVTIQWNATVSEVTGDVAVKRKDACTLTYTRDVLGAELSADDDRQLQFACGATLLYDSTKRLNGESSYGSSIDEVPAAGEALAYQYTLESHDIGTRVGDRNQITLTTPQRALEAFREVAPSFRVKAAVDSLSQVRRGQPLLAKDKPPFTQVVQRIATVEKKSGKVPFKGISCSLRISPAYVPSVDPRTCRALLNCGSTVAFGVAQKGFERCPLVSGAPTGFSDPRPTSEDGDARFDVDLAKGTAVLGDGDGASKYEVSFRLE